MQYISWNSFEVYPESKILYRNNYYSYLFYEASICAEFGKIEYGWIIEKVDNFYILNGIAMSRNQLLEFLSYALLDLGLYENEVTDFISYWFFEQDIFIEDGMHILHQLSREWIDYNFQLTTTNLYSQNRLFFKYYYMPANSLNLQLNQPRNVLINQDSNYILHEWGIIF